MMDTTTQTAPSRVPETATQDGEILLRWSWVEWAVWTPRRLTALEQGVKGDVWLSLIDKVFSERNLRAAFCKVAANDGAPGVDHVTVSRFERDLEANLRKLSEQLPAGTDCPQAVRRVHIPKPGTKDTRPLGIPTVRDRVVQAAGGASRSGTDLRERIRSPQLRLPTATRLHRRAATSGPTLEGGLRVRGGRRPQELFRHDPA